MREDESSSEDEDDDDDEDDKDDEIEDYYTVEDLIVEVVDLIPLLGETTDAETFRTHFGGYQRHLLKLLVRTSLSFYRR